MVDREGMIAVRPVAKSGSTQDASRFAVLERQIPIYNGADSTASTVVRCSFVPTPSLRRSRLRTHMVHEFDDDQNIGCYIDGRVLCSNPAQVWANHSRTSSSVLVPA